MANVNLTIDGKQISVPAGTTILAAAKANDIYIPTLYVPVSFISLFLVYSFIFSCCYFALVKKTHPVNYTVF